VLLRVFESVKAVGIRHADHVTPIYPQKLTLTSPTNCGRSVDIVRSRTKATELVKVAQGKFLTKNNFPLLRACQVFQCEG
jgi:hypothetical protein